MAEPTAYLDQLRAAFNAELEERERELNRLLLLLERGGGDRTPGEILDALFREAHSLKGAARAVEMPLVERLAHAIESALDRARKQGMAPERGWFDAAYRAIDAFDWVRQSMKDGEGSFPHDIDEILLGLGEPSREGNGAKPTREQRPTGPASNDFSRPRPLPSIEQSAQEDQDPLPPIPLTPVLQPRNDEPPPEPPRPVAAAAASDVSTATSGESVRVAVNKLDALLSQAGELAVTRIRVDQRLGELRDLLRELATWRREWRDSRERRAALRRAADAGEGLQPSTGHDVADLLRFVDRAEQRAHGVADRIGEISQRLSGDSAQLGVVTHTLQDHVMAVRLLPVATIVGPFTRMVRDLTRTKAKEASLVLEGVETEIDRRILEQLRDPLMHMLRNAIDHGIESPADRVAQGKPRAGVIKLSVQQRGGSVEFELTDDGAGMNPARLRATAVAKGVITADAADELDDESSFELIFFPGLSTSATVTDTSGRGVGMDVVRENVERLNGHVKASGVPGKGSTFLISVPLTLATLRAILVEQGDRLFAIPARTVLRTARVQERQITRVEGRPTVALDGRPVPVVDLADILELSATQEKARDTTQWRPLIVLQQGDRRVALQAERLKGEQEIVVKRLAWPLRRVRNVGGAAVLGSGEIAVILNPSDMLKAALRTANAPVSASRRGRATGEERPADQPRPRLLVVDDSLTTRTLVRSILDAAGYEVVVATDGVEAMNVLRAGRVDLVVSDIEMPRLDGFGLTAEIRRDERLRRTPIILITSLEAPEHRERGVGVGADAYIVKGRFDQGELLDTIGRLL